MPNEITISFNAAAQLAERLRRPGSPSLVDEIGQLQAEAKLAGRLIEQLLRGVPSTDFWRLPPEGGA